MEMAFVVVVASIAITAAFVRLMVGRQITQN